MPEYWNIAHGRNAAKTRIVELQPAMSSYPIRNLERFDELVSDRVLKFLLTAILVVIGVRLWLMPLPSSFWVDEMATVFVVHHGAQDPSLTVAPQVAQSIYYVLPKVAARLLGDSEIAYRLPSVFAMAGVLFLVARLAIRLIHPQAAWFAVFASLSLRGINYQADDARPYALGTFVAAVSVLLMVRWLDSARWSDGLLFVAAAALLWRVHLIYWPFYAIFPVYTFSRLMRRETEVTARHAAAMFGLLGISLLPVLNSAIALNRQAAAHVVARVPTLNDLITEMKLGLIVGSCAIAVMAGRWFHWPQATNRVCSPSSLLLILCLWLSQPLGLFGFSWITGNSVFLPRYLSIALPGAALTATLAAAPFIPAARWKAVSFALGVGILLFMGQWGHAWPVHHDSGWKTEALRINKLGLGPDVPVICPSPFIEARPQAWKPDYSQPGFLYAHLPVYPIAGRIYPFPFKSSPEAEAYATRLSREKLAAEERFIIYGGAGSVLFWSDWFSTRLELSGRTRIRLGPVGDVDAVLFEKAPLSASDGHFSHRSLNYSQR